MGSDNSEHIKLIQSIIHDLSKSNMSYNGLDKLKIGHGRTNMANEYNNPLRKLVGKKIFPGGIDIGKVLCITDIERHKYEAFESVVDISDTLLVGAVELMYRTNMLIMHVLDESNEKRLTLAYSKNATDFNTPMEIWYFKRLEQSQDLLTADNFTALMRGPDIIKTDTLPDGHETKLIYDRLSTEDIPDLDTKYHFTKNIQANDYNTIIHRVSAFSRDLHNENDLVVSELLELELYMKKNTWYLDIWAGVKLNHRNVTGLSDHV